MNNLMIESVYAGYGKKEVLRNISIDLVKSKIISLIGPNGAGKSTLLKVISGFLKPWSGRLFLNKNEITQLEAFERRKLGIAYFMQGGKIFPSLKVEENLKLGLVGFRDNERKTKIEEILLLFPNLRDLMSARAGILSGGERQALALAMILLNKPKYLLLDEPSAGLAPKLVKSVLEKIKEINLSWRLTVLIVEQNVGEALKISDKAIALFDGQIIYETDEPLSLIEGKTLEDLFFGKELTSEKKFCIK